MGIVSKTRFVQWATLILLCACATGCGTTIPRQYAQGIPVAPAAPAFSPALDAPITTGQPGYIGPAESTPRSPYSRELPQTPETRKGPGLWSWDEPTRAIDRRPRFMSSVLDGQVTLPPGVSEDEVRAANECTGPVNKLMLRDPALLRRYSVLSDREKKCASLRIYMRCLETKSGKSAAAEKLLATLLSSAEAAVVVACRDAHDEEIAVPPELVEDIVHAVERGSP